jgi:hypothetical protein
VKEVEDYARQLTASWETTKLEKAKYHQRQRPAHFPAMQQNY